MVAIGQSRPIEEEAVAMVAVVKAAELALEAGCSERTWTDIFRAVRAERATLKPGVQNVPA